MANTIIQIKRSTTTSVPTGLEAGELAFTSNGDTLWIGSPSGSNTANVIHIGSKISYFANSTQLGDETSDEELVSSLAIKTYVDGVAATLSGTLSDLDDVTISSVANNDLLVYDAAAGKWENHTISGTANEVEVNISSQNITVGLPNNVVITSNLTVNSALTVNQGSQFNNTVIVQVGVSGTPHTVTNPTVQIEANTDGWTQTSIHNRSGGVNASSDFIAYPNNTQNDDNTGFIDMGITSDGYSQAAYSITGPNDGYIFTSARAGDALSGSMVLATDSTGTNNDIKFFVGGFTFNANTPHMVLAGNTRSFGINNTAPVSKLTVGGDAWIGGNTETYHVLPLANTTYSIGSAAKYWLNVYANTVLAANVSATNIFGTLQTASQPNITTLGSLTDLTVNGNTTLGSDSADVVTFNAAVNSSVVPSANGTANLGSSTKYWNQVYGNNATFGTVTVSGDLTVQGTLTTIDTNELVVEDPMIRLAKNQATGSTFTDAVDIGFYGTYGNTSQVVYAGLARDASSNTFILFDGLVNQAPDNVVNTAAITLTTLNSYLSSSGLTTNATTVAITANSTVNVAIVANTLTLSTALTVGNGGTGKTTFTNNAVIFGYGTGVLQEATGSNGQILQIVSNVPTFGGLDGGTF